MYSTMPHGYEMKRRIKKHIHHHLIRRTFYKLMMQRIVAQLLSSKTPRLTGLIQATQFTMPQQGTKVLTMRRFEEPDEN
jgi:hypothetical protein